MKILFIEDTPIWIEWFLPQLQTLGEVTHFKSVHKAVTLLDEEEFDLIVCDHYVQAFEEDTRIPGDGVEIYFNCRCVWEKTPFIHFSSDPCPELYPTENDKNFYSLKKEMGAKLLSLIKDIGMSKEKP